jgi:2-polyprenyl-3-methyl-5-hydroxy-6-metoxy-1,4-benzoquinol methylase
VPRQQRGRNLAELILDAAYGRGLLGAALLENGNRVAGADLSEQTIERA